MTEAMTLKVPKEVFQRTLDKLGDQIDELKRRRDDLQREINRMTGSTFSGTDVEPAIEAAQEALKRTEKAIVKVTAQRDTIQDYLNATESTAATLERDMRSEVTSQLPDLFR